MTIVREDKLTETAPKRPLALTFGAVAVTLLIILGVLSAPTVISCFNSENGFGQCVNGKLADMGLLPRAEVPANAVADTTTAAAPTEAPAAVEPEVELTPPALDVTPPAETEPVPDTLIAATFGLLRAEPDGSVVIAGSGTPGSEVEVYADDALIGSTTVERSGDWVFVPDQPLPVGGVEITLAERGKTGRAEQSFVVVIDEDKSAQPLVVASVPGQASEVLQGLDRPAATTAVATATPPAATAPQTAEVATPPAPAAAPAAPEPAVTEPAIAVAAATPEAPAAATPLEPVPPTEPAASPAPEAPAEPAAAPAAIVPPAPPAPAVTPETPEAPPADEPALAEAPAAATVTPPAAPVALASVAPTIDAIEIEGDRTFFAGSGPDGGIVRLYVDDAVVADSTIDGGRWLVEAGPVLEKPSQRVRADLLAPGAPAVIARAEVDFEVEMPAPAVAEAPAPEPTPAATEPAPQVADVAPAAPPTQQPAAPAAAQQPAAQAPTATPEAPPPVVAEAPAVETPAVPRMVAVSIGGPDAQRFASGKAIIRRGDNLWTIARRVYGEGIKYTTIYEANNGQIRDPDRIYPGQVFSLPQ